MLYITGISIAFFLSFVLFSKKSKSIADKILACWLVVMGLHLLFFYLFIAGQIFSYPWMLGIHIPFPLLHGPFLYLYAAAITGRIQNLTKAGILHFLVPLVFYIYLIPFFLLTPEEKIFVYKNKGVGYESFMLVCTIAIVASGITYVMLTTLLHRKHRKSILNEFSFTEKINLDWIQYLVCGIAIIWVFVILRNDNLVFGTAVFFVMFIGYFGIRQVGIFSNPYNPKMITEGNTGASIPGEDKQTSHSVELNDAFLSTAESFENSMEDSQTDEVIARKKYAKSGLSNITSNQLHKELQALVDSEKIFNRNNLTLTELAGRLGTHPNYLSQVINEKEGKNFYDYINTLRTEEFKKLVSDPLNQKYTLLHLAYECGFNSKSSFNKYFKKVTGYSPSEYLKLQKSI